MTNNLFTIEELLQFNEMMLGRGMPITEDGVGYNKADYGACATYFYGLSDAQIADLSKRLVKYCKTQLGVDKEQMKETAKHYAELTDGADRSDGISIDVREDGVLISFRYNETFIELIKSQPKRQWDSESKNWIVPLDEAVSTLNALWTVGADVRNALIHIMNNDIYLDFLEKQHEEEKVEEVEKTEVLTKLVDDMAFLKFKYNKIILEEIKQIDRKDREWNPDFKFWVVRVNYLEELRNKLSNVAEFKIV